MRLVQAPPPVAPAPVVRGGDDPITGLPTDPIAALAGRRILRLGIVYLQVGRSTRIEGLYGFQIYDRILALASESIRAEVERSPLKSRLVSILFSGSDGFFVLFELPAKEHSRLGSQLEDEAWRLRDGVIRGLARSLGRSTANLLMVQASASRVSRDPRVRPERNLLRALGEAKHLVATRETRERRTFLARFRALVADGSLRARYQPVVEIASGRTFGYEALIRGPEGSDLESPDVLFAAAREGGLELELESLCLERIFERLPRALAGCTLFVNASARLLSHAFFLDERNLEKLRAAHDDIVLEISEKEVVWDYASFRETLDLLREHGFEVAIDDAGSGYSGLEAILQIRPRYIKVAESIVKGLDSDPIKREVILALQSLARQIDASVVAEGIETAQEKQALIDLGVRYGQGFFLGMPAVNPQRAADAASLKPRTAR